VDVPFVISSSYGNPKGQTKGFVTESLTAPLYVALCLRLEGRAARWQGQGMLLDPVHVYHAFLA
jgi:hypothetical protein